MSAVFINLLNMSITASYIVLALILLRLLFKKAPKWLVCLLWGLVGIRLIFPFSIESALSLIPSAKTVPQEIVYAKEPTIDSGITVINNIVNPIMIESFAPSSELTSINPIQIWLALAENIWVLGIAAMLIYTLISYISLKRKTRASIEIEKGIYICDNVATPFILGLFVPRIILPSAMDEKNVSYVIAHEKAHIRRLDHLWKPLGFALLSVYWFNPVMWVAYILFCRDIELACDERVIRDMGDEDKKAYSSALLSCSMPRKMITACPLAFGEVGVKERIKGVLNYKKPAFWLIVAAVIASAVIAVCFLTDPDADKNTEIAYKYSVSYAKKEKDVKSDAEKQSKIGKIYSTALNAEHFTKDGTNHLPIHRFNSADEFKHFKEYYSDVFVYETTYNEIPSFNNVTEKYNDDFFREQTLFLTYVTTKSGSVRFSVKDIKIEEESCVLTITNTTPAEINDYQGWFLTIAIDKSDIKGCTKFDAVWNETKHGDALKKDPASTSVSFIDDDFENEFAVSKAFVFAGVAANYEVYYEAQNADKQGLYGYEFLPIHKLESVSDISAFKEKFSDFQFSHTLDLPQFDDIAVEYNDEFFKDNILLITHVVTQGVGNCLINTGNVSKENVVFYIEKEEEKNSDALYGWLLCIGVNRRFIDNDTQFDAIVINEGSILGTWVAPASVVGLNVSEIPENASVYYAFYADGTGAEWNDINADVAHIFADMYRREFTYTVENGILTITYLNDSKLADDDFVQFRYTASGTRLTLSDVNTNRILELTRFIGEPVYNDEVVVFEKDTEIRFFGANDIPKNPVAINSFKIEFKRNGAYSSIVFPNKDYLDNTTITELGTTEPVFGFSIYQDTLNYTDKLLSTLTSCVTVDYEGNEHDQLDTAKEHIYIEINGKAAELLEVSQGKGNGHLDFYFKFKVEKPFLPSEIDSLKISVK